MTEVVPGFEKLGVPAERLGRTAGKRTSPRKRRRAVLQDKLLLPFALAGGGTFTSVKLSEQTRTAAHIIERFTGRRFGMAAQDTWWRFA